MDHPDITHIERYGYPRRHLMQDEDFRAAHPDKCGDCGERDCRCDPYDHLEYEHEHNQTLEEESA